MISSVKYLPHKYEDLGSDPSNQPKSQAWQSVPVIPTLGKQGQKDPRDLVRTDWSSQLTSEGEILSLV